MATVNRYTQYTPNVYNPRSLDELMKAPGYMREQHDNLSAAYSELDANVANIDPLDLHSNEARMEQERLYNSITEQADLLNTEGFNPAAKSSFLKVNKDYQRTVSPTGKLGQITAAKKIFEENKQKHIETAVKNGFSSDDALRNWSQWADKYKQEFEETGKITPIGELGSPLYKDYVQEAKDVFEAAGFSKEDLHQGKISKLITTDPNGTYVLTTGGGTATESNRENLQKAVEWLNQAANNPNSDIYKSIEYEGKDPKQILNEIQTLSGVYLSESESNNRSEVITNFAAAKNVGVPSNRSVQYESEKTKVYYNTQTGIQTKLGNIISGTILTEEKVSFDELPSLSNPPGHRRDVGNPTVDKTTKTASFENQFGENEKTQYLEYVGRLTTVFPRLAELDPFSNEAAKIVKKYLDDHTGKILHQNAIITDDIATVYGNRTVGVVPKSKSAVKEQIQLQAHERQFEINGKIIPYAELSKNQKLALKSGSPNFQYTGYYSPQNYLQKENAYQDFEGDENFYVSPLKGVFIDPDTGERTEVKISRSSSEMKEAGFQADKTFNRVFRETRELPFVPTQIDENSTVSFIPQGTILDGQPTMEDSYFVSIQDENGSSVGNYTAEELQDMFYRAYGVTENTDNDE